MMFRGWQEKAPLLGHVSALSPIDGASASLMLPYPLGAMRRFYECPAVEMDAMRSNI